MISTARRAGNNNEARIFSQQRDMLTKMVDDAVPEYAQARNAFSSRSAVIDALEDGRTIFSRQLTPNELRSRLGQMDEAQREAFIQGGRAAIADIMGTARNDATAARNLFAQGYNREKLSMLVGGENTARMLKSLDAEQAFANSRNRVVSNSETFARAQAAKDIGVSGKEPGVIREALNMNAGNAAAKFADRFTGKMQTAAQQKSNAELARYLTVRADDPKSLIEALSRVTAAQKRGVITNEQARQFIINAQMQFHQRNGTGRSPLEITVGRPN